MGCFWFSCAAVAASVLPFVPAMVREGRLADRRGRQARGLCANCGYDLRASRGRCPECGEPR